MVFVNVILKFGLGLHQHLHPASGHQLSHKAELFCSTDLIISNLAGDKKMMVVVITITLIDPIWLMGVAWDACSHGALRPNRVPTVRDRADRQPLHCQKSSGDRHCCCNCFNFGVIK